MIEIKRSSCLFCKGTSTSFIVTSPVEFNVPRKMAVICLTCNARGPEANTELEAMIVWNKRADAILLWNDHPRAVKELLHGCLKPYLLPGILDIEDSLMLLSKTIHTSYELLIEAGLGPRKPQ